MTLGLYLRVSPSSFDIFFQSERLTLLYIYFIWNAPLFALAFEGALLPLCMHEPALSPLLALPKRIEPRTEYRGIHLLFMKRAVQSYYIFLLSASQRANFSVIYNISKLARGPRPEARQPPFGGGVLRALRAPDYTEGTVSSVSNGSVNSQSTAPQLASAPEGALLPSSTHEPALSPSPALPKRKEPRTEPSAATGL